MTLVGLICVYAASQLGGITVPKLASKIGLFMWGLWMSAVGFQWLATFVSLIMACESFVRFSAETGECQIPSGMVSYNST